MDSSSDDEWEKTRKAQLANRSNSQSSDSDEEVNKDTLGEIQRKIAELEKEKKKEEERIRLLEKEKKAEKVRLRLQQAASSSNSAKPKAKAVAVPAQPVKTRVSYAVPRLKPDIQATTHRVVDPMTDEGVWVVVDEGANSCCHGDEWRRNAEDKIYKKGFRFNAVHHRSTEFKGIGNRKSKGLWNVPLGFVLQDSKDTYQGQCQSHELANSIFPRVILGRKMRCTRMGLRGLPR